MVKKAYSIYLVWKLVINIYPFFVLLLLLFEIVLWVWPGGCGLQGGAPHVSSRGV